MSADPAEIAKFSALAARWWDQAGPFAALHRMNPVRLGFIRDRLAPLAAPGGKPLAGLKVVDLACGGGLVSAPLARLGADVTAIDAAPEAIGAARAYAEEAALSVRYEVSAAEDFAAAHEGAFDAVIALEVVEHVADLDAFLDAAAQLARPGGVVIVSTINRTAQARALALFAAEKVLHMAPDGAHEYEKLVKPEELEVAPTTLHWEPPVGISFDPIGRTWRLSSDVSMNYLRAAVRAAG
jgi:2-polyprenyl-6-hydroxyphenyl methylase/3-demethylubiquinone-9 3-methyltransferase